MRFEIEKETLLRPLQAILGVVERRQTLPVLANVLLVADDTGLSMTATDLEVELQAHTPLAAQEGGQITVPARKLMDIVRNLPDDASIQFNVEQDRAVLRSGRSRFSLATLPAGEFPVVEEIGATEGLDLEQSHLRWLIERTHFAMALQDVRYYLNGLLLEVSTEGLRAVATDGHRLALAGLAAPLDITDSRQVIVPRKGIQELLRILGDVEAGVRIELGTNHVRAVLPDLRFTSKLIDGRFPDYERVVPQTGEQPMRVGRDDLRQALVRVSILSNEKYRGVRFALDGERLRIQSNNPEQEEAEEELDVEYGGEPVEIGFNASYMLDALAAIEQPAVVVHLKDGNSSALVQGEDASDARYVVMPMRL